MVKRNNSLTELSVDNYVERSHILVSMRDDFKGAYDKILDRQKQSRVIWSTSHFMIVPFLLANSDCVALLPNRMAQHCARNMNLKLLPLPIEIEGFTVSMVWHRRNNNSLQHQWLRQQIIDAVRNV